MGRRLATAVAVSVRTTVGPMRTSLLLLVMATVLTACAGGGSKGSGATVDRVEKTTTAAAELAVPSAVRALEAEKVEAFGQWQSCMALSWRYEVFASMTVPKGDAAAQLAAVKAALVEGGWTDDTQVDDQVTLTRDDTTVNVTPSPARGPGRWVMKVQSSCADYDGDDKDRVENDEARPIRGIAP